MRQLGVCGRRLGLLSALVFGALAAVADTPAAVAPLHGVATAGSPTTFAWSGTITTLEKMTLTSRPGCSGSVTATISQTITILRRGQVATEVAKGIWEVRAHYSRNGAPKVSVQGKARCEIEGGFEETSVGSATVSDAGSASGALLVRYDAEEARIEIVPEYGRALLANGSVVQSRLKDEQPFYFSGSESVVGGYGLPRLELHPAQDAGGDYRARASQPQANLLALRPAGYQRALDGPGDSGFAGSPITTFHGFLGHVGSPALSMGYDFTEHVRGSLIAKVYGPDRDHDGLNDGADPDPGKADSDGDGFPDYWETTHGTNPRSRSSHPRGRCCPGAPDADGDGHSDPQEIAGGTDPNDPEDVPKAKPDSPIRYKPPGSGGGGDDEDEAEVVPAGCHKNLIFFECRVMLSMNQTVAAASTAAYRKNITYGDIAGWCKGLLISITPRKLSTCIGTPASIAASSLSLARGLLVATSRLPPWCFYYRGIRHRTRSGWSEWSLQYDPLDFLYDKGMQTTYGGKTFVCSQA